jgi:hypothetical protein
VEEEIVTEIVVYAVSKDGDGKVIEIHRTDWEDEDSFDLPPLVADWIYQVCRETKRVEK